MRFSVLVAIATLALAACHSTPPADAVADDGAMQPVPATTTAAAPPTTTACNADAAKDAVGKQATPEVIEQARIAAGATLARALRPDMMITMEYRDDRLNLRTDTANVVASVSCG